MDAYQVKHGEEAQNYTLNALFSRAKKDTGEREDSLFEQLCNGWKRLDGGTAIFASRAIVASDPVGGRKIVFHRWLNDIITGEATFARMFAEFDELLPLFFHEIPHRELWLLLRRHAVEFAEVRENPDIIEPFVFRTSMEPNGNCLMQWFELGCNLGNPEVEDECVRGLLELIKLRAYDIPVRRLLDKWLAEDDQSQARALGLLHVSLSYRDDFVQDYQEQIQQLRLSNAFFLRDAATRIASRLNFPIVVTQQAKLHPGYTLVLPPILEPEHRIPASFYGPGQISPESEDPWEWVGIAHVELKILADVSGIPLQNLVRRTAALMQDIAPRDNWNSAAEQKMKLKMEKFGLRLSWPRLRSSMASRALACVLTELIDAGKIEIGLAYALRSRLDPVDLMALQLQPQERPAVISVPNGKEMDEFRSKEWLQNTQQALPKCVRRLLDGRVIIAELSQFRHWGHGDREEIRMSCWSSSRYKPDGGGSLKHGLFEGNSWWRLDEYQHLTGASKIQSLSLFLTPVFVRSGHLDFLVANPIPCGEMGWDLAGVGKWLSDGKVMIETLWWTDGPRRRADLHSEEISGEGWLVVAQPEAAKALMEKFPCVVRNRVVRLSDTDPYGDSGFHNVANQTLNVANWMDLSVP